MFKVEIAILGIVSLLGYSAMTTFPALINPVIVALNGGL